jgi:integrase
VYTKCSFSEYCFRLSNNLGLIAKRFPDRMGKDLRVLSALEESRYLAACPEPLHTVATLLADTGMRPEECYRLRWEGVTWTVGAKGSLQVAHGKTPAARRFLPMTVRVRQAVEALHEAQSSPTEGWMFPANTRSGHLEPSTVKKHHASIFQVLAEDSKTSGLDTVRPFVFYTFRHTFATRLGESGIDAWTMCRVMGWGNVSMSNRYVHPSTETVFLALERLDATPRRSQRTLPQ